MTEVRRALLVGVGETPEAAREFGSLAEPVAADLAAMRTALEESGYEVEEVDGEAGRAAITTAVYEAASAVPEGGTLLLYFTGHGVRHGDTDYLVPADARAPQDGNWRPPYLDSLLPADISPYLTDCRAGLVLWLVDACRDPVDDGPEAFGTRIVRGQPSGGFAVMVGCSPGQQGGFTPEGSHFTRGLAEALGSLSAPRTVEEVHRAAAEYTARAARRQGLTQDVWIRYGGDRDSETRSAVICSGRRLLEEWRAAVTDRRIWGLLTPGTDRTAARLQGHLLDLVESCAGTVHRAQSQLPDPWADDDFPVRLLRLLPQLLPTAPGTLSPAEAAALIAAPFLREAAWADRLHQAAAAEPLCGERLPEAGQLRRHLEQVQDHYRQATRKLIASSSRGRAEDAAALGLWLVHRWIGERLETDESPVPPEPVGRFAVEASGGGERSGELASLLRDLASEIGLDLPREGGPDHEPLRFRLADGEVTGLRYRPLAALLRLAAALAADARTFPSVIADHLAVSDPVTPAEVVRLVRSELDWERDGQGLLHLHLVSPHQALHAAMAETVERADRMAKFTTGLRGRLPETEAALLASVPHRVTDNHLRPGTRDGRSRYEVPLLRFQLAQTEVRELLMGRQLYGEPELAIRELYQNAMDACRYREMRWRHLRSKGPVPVSWTGRITFTQGVDEAGRRYVECRDNGVGMGREQLKSTFTRAGRRFEQSRSFRREQAAWLRHDPSLRLYPNSRFGIGVLSYFMLADEMTVVTREVFPDGAVAPHALRVEIPSSGSLFRIQQQTDPTEDNLPEGGTRVRLYLREEPEPVEVSCVATLRGLVPVSEFAMVARHAGREEEWRPGELREGPWNLDGGAHQAVPGTLWFVEAGGAVLCDGVLTDQRPYGYVLNLTGPHAGELSVDRKTLQEYDQDWERSVWRAGAAELLRWPRLGMEWLWEVESRTIGLARTLWREWAGTGVEVRHRIGEDEEIGLPLDAVGWYAEDGLVLRHVGDEQEHPWRSAVLAGYVGAEPCEDAPASLLGFPVPEPGDRSLVGHAQDWASVIESASAQGRTAREAWRVLRSFRVVGPFEGAPPAGAPSPDGVPDAVDIRVARALTGQQSKTVSAGQVVTERGDPRSLLETSRQTGWSLGVLFDRAVRLGPLHGFVLPEVPEDLRDHVVTDREIETLYLPFSVEDHRWIRSAADLAAVARARERVTLEEHLETVRRYGWLGWKEPDPHEVQNWLELTRAEAALLRRHLDTTGEGAPVIGWGAAVELADARGSTVGEAEDHLRARAPQLGAVFGRPGADTLSGGTSHPSDALVIVVRDVQESGWFLEDGLGVEALGLVLGRLDEPETLQAIAELTRLGVALPPDTRLLAAWGTLSVRSRTALSGRNVQRESGDFPAEDITGAVLFAAAWRLQEDLGEIWEVAGREAARFGLSLPELPDDLREIRPDEVDVEALLGWGYDTDLVFPSPDDEGPAAPVWKDVTLRHLVIHADELQLPVGTAYRLLARLRPIGALVPELTDGQLDALDGLEPDARVLVALDDSCRVSHPGTPLVPMDLVSIAGCLGETVEEVWQRIEPYLVVGPPPQVPERPDVLPLWQDFAILSVHLDGMLPAVEGRVSREHVALVAVELDVAQAWVWGRLELYRGMFGLDLGERP
ncbi:caspase family protein [Kitasatospora sp. NPDC051853]|uniref:HD domain-containing protein n=1 Tax=Kitasatospora sp. NPDC051853 TaxID=3364058 RepID=UPI0037A5CC4F